MNLMRELPVKTADLGPEKVILFPDAPALLRPASSVNIKHHDESTHHDGASSELHTRVGNREPPHRGHGRVRGLTNTRFRRNQNN